MTRAIAVVAHYDDALLWVGGTIKRTLCCGWEWTVLAMCVEPELEYEYKQCFFDDWCESLHIHHHPTSEFKDYQPGNPFSQNNRCEMRDEMRKAILRETQDGKFDWVFTHPLEWDGEYGHHANHMEAAETVEDLARRNEICDGVAHVAHFAYKPIYGTGGKATAAKTDACFYVQLKYDELLWKCEWCQKADSQGDDLKSLAWPCPNPEAFSLKHLDLPKPFRGR